MNIVSERAPAALSPYTEAVLWAQRSVPAASFALAGGLSLLIIISEQYGAFMASVVGSER